MNDNDFFWLVGLLEGEACFRTSGNCPLIKVNMKDQDIVERIQSLLGSPSVGQYQQSLSFWTQLSGKPAAKMMRRLIPHMGKRRQEQIDKALTAYKPIRLFYGRLKTSDIPKIRKLLRQGKTQRVIGCQFGVHRQTIARIAQGKIWTHA